MQEMLNSESSDDEKTKLYNPALQKSKLFQKKVPAKKVVKEKPIPKSEILRKFIKKAQATHLLHEIQNKKNIF